MPLPEVQGIIDAKDLQLTASTIAEWQLWRLHVLGSLTKPKPLISGY